MFYILTHVWIEKRILKYYNIYYITLYLYILYKKLLNYEKT